MVYIDIDKKKLSLAAAFFLPLFITAAICINRGVYPFGDRCILHVDMYHQYCPFFSEFLQNIRDGSLFSYSWNIGLGADFVSLYAYYLASPLNWLIVLCPGNAVVEFMTILVVVKIAACGLTAAYYLCRHFETEHMAAAVFGTAYALCAFTAAYSWNIMWTDCMALLPLILLGLERLIKEGRPLLYYGTLALCIFSNYYISIMICIFLVFWFLLIWAENRGTGIRAWVRFAWYSALAGGTGAVLIIPTAIVLGYSGAGGISFPKSVEWYFDLISELSRHFVLTETYTGSEHWPNLYCGLFVPVLFVLYLLNREISWKRKVPRVFLAVLFVLSFSNNILDFFWHGLHFPTSLPGRQSFIYCFLLLVICFEAFCRLRGNRVWHLLVATNVCVAFLMCAYFLAEDRAEQTMRFVMTAVFFCCYLILLTGYLAGAKRVRRLLASVGAFAVIAELAMNLAVTGLDTVSRTSYHRERESYRILLERAEAMAEDAGVLFYRTEQLERKTKNDAALYGYHSATQFSSLMNLNVSHFYQDVGMEGGKNFYSYSGATPLLEAMLSVRYVLADNDREAGPLRALLTSAGEYSLYENRYTLPLGFVMDEAAAEAWDYDGPGDIETQNRLAYLLGADDAMLVPVESVSEPGKSGFTAERTGYYYAAYEKTSIGNLTEQTSDGRSRSYTKVSHGYTLDLGYCEEGVEVTVTNTDNEELPLRVYYLNLDAFYQAYEALGSQPFVLTLFENNRIEGTVRLVEAGRLIFSVADEQGWTLFVDGKETESETFAEAFISTRLAPGEHQITLRYETPGLRAGAACSGICLLLAAASIYLSGRKKGEGQEADSEKNVDSE